MSLTKANREMYRVFTVDFPFCMNCGWDGTEYREWMFHELHCAHIIGGPHRRHDRRCLVRLCQACHMLAHGATIKVEGVKLANLSFANLLWLKRHHDIDHYDRKYLRELLGRKTLPRISRPKVLHGWKPQGDS